MIKTLYFVTTNARKFEEYREYFSGRGISLVQHAADLVEPQQVDGFAITQYKLEQARKLLPRKKVLVDDRGFNIPALNNFPGPMLKLILGTIGVKGIEKLMQDEPDRRAEFTTTIGYYDGRDEHFFQTRENGFLTQQAQGTNLHGWTELLYLYGHSSFPGRSLAELDDEEWEKYLEALEHESVLTQFAKIDF